MFYTTQAHFEALFDGAGQADAFRAETEAECLVWQAALREKLYHVLGCDTMRHAPAKARILETVACDGYTRIKMLIHTEPDVQMPFYLLQPDGCTEGTRRRAVIACHGHCGGGKDAVAGIRDVQPVIDAIAEYNYNYGEQLARLGYMVFCPDARGFGERREKALQGDAAWQITGSSCSTLNSMALSLGQSVTGMWLWDLMRLVDYILSREDVVDSPAVVGLSGGGLQALWLAAMDTRMRCAVVSGYFYGYRESLLSEECCSCNYVPNLWRMVDIGDVGALIAPRPLVIETGTEDSLNGASGLGNVLPQVDTVRRAMALFGATNHLYHDIFQGGHRFHGDMAFAALARHHAPYSA